MLDRVGMSSLNETNKTMGRSCGDAPATGRTVRSKESAFPGGRAYVDPLARTAPIRSGRLRRYRCAPDEHPNGNGATIFRGVGGTRGRFDYAGRIAEMGAWRPDPRQCFPRLGRLAYSRLSLRGIRRPGSRPARLRDRRLQGRGDADASALRRRVAVRNL